MCEGVGIISKGLGTAVLQITLLAETFPGFLRKCRIYNPAIIDVMKKTAATPDDTQTIMLCWSALPEK